MARIFATYSPCCGIFHLGEADPGVMHCALPHDKKVVVLADVSELDAQLQRIAKLESLCRQCASWIEHAEDDRPEDSKECARARSKLIRGALVHDELLPGK